MKVVLRTSRADGSNRQMPGDVIDLDASEAKRLIESNQARPFEGNAVSTASVEQNQRGSNPTRRSRKVKS